MKVRCLKVYPSEDESKHLGEEFARLREFHISVGTVYLVLGVSFWQNTTWVDIECDSGHVTHVPLMLFEIVDPTVSKYWVCNIRANNTVVFWPPSWLQEYYHDDLLEGRDSVVEDLASVKKLLEDESSQQT